MAVGSTEGMGRSRSRSPGPGRSGGSRGRGGGPGQPDTTDSFGAGMGRDGSGSMPPSFMGVLAQMAMPQIANEVRSLFTGAPDEYPNAPPDLTQRDEGGPGRGIHRRRRSFAQSPFSGLGG